MPQINVESATITYETKKEPRYALLEIGSHEYWVLRTKYGEPFDTPHFTVYAKGERYDMQNLASKLNSEG